jgi:hypothetical protein
MILRWYGEGQQAAWQGLLLVSLLVTVVLRAQEFLRHRRPRSEKVRPALRTLAVDSGEPPDPHRLWGPGSPPRFSAQERGPVRSEVRQPVLATSQYSTAYSRGTSTRPAGYFDTREDPNDMVRQMRRAASHGGPIRGALLNRIVLGAALLLVNPVGIWLTWSEASLRRRTQLLLSAVSVLWYLGVAGLVFLLTHH